MASADTWWHLATGRWIVQHHAIPHTDPFSYTFFGKPWIAHEYLADVMFYWIHWLGGFAALTLVNAAILTAAFLLVYRRAEAGRWTCAAALLLGVYAVRPSFAIRPASITLLLGSVFLWIAHRYLRDGRWGRLLWCPALMLLWVQLHAGYMLGIGLLLATASAEALDAMAGRGQATRKEIATLLGAAVACIAIVPLNPNGVAMLRYPFDVLGMRVNAFIYEWQPLQLSDSRYYPFLALALLTLLAMLFSPKLYRPGELLLFAVFLAAALRSGRNLSFFALIAVPLLAEHARVDWIARLAARLRFPGWLTGTAAGAAVLACAVLCAWQSAEGARFQRSAESEVFPKAAVDFLLRHHLRPKLLNDYAWGGYLIWRFEPDHPEYRVYVDGRADLYGDAFLLPFQKVYLAQESPDAILQREQINTVLLFSGAKLADLFRIKSGNGSWILIYEDSRAVIFVHGEQPAVADARVPSPRASE
jgi:hypothetical protein